MKQFFFLSLFCLFLLGAAPVKAQACIDNAECSPETCISFFCAPLSSISGPCDPGDGEDCQSGNCDGTTCIASGSGSGGSSGGGSGSGSGGSSGGGSGGGSGSGSGGSSGGGSGSSGAGGPPCSDPNYELPSGYAQAVEDRFNQGVAAGTVPEYIVDIGRYALNGAEHTYAVRKITGNPLPTIRPADYMSISQINALGQDKFFFIATLPPAGPMSSLGNTVAAVRQATLDNFPGITNACPVQGGGIVP